MKIFALTSTYFNGIGTRSSLRRMRVEEEVGAFEEENEI